MRIVAFTDTHGSGEALLKLSTLVKRKSPDLLLCCGDISIFENGLDEVLGVIAKMSVPMLVVHGNHEDDDVMQEACKNYPQFKPLHKKAIKSQDVLFMGHGGGGFNQTDRRFELLSEQFSELMKKYPEEKKVFISHAPPFGTTLDDLDEEHVGNKSYTKFLVENQIDYCFSGHIHENFGKTDKINNCQVINPGPEGKCIDL